MQVWREGMIALLRVAPEILHRHTIPAFIGIRDGVQRLVQISDKMNDKAKRIRAFRHVRFGILQDGKLFGDCSRDAAFLSAKGIKRPALRTTGYVDVMP